MGLLNALQIILMRTMTQKSYLGVLNFLRLKDIDNLKHAKARPILLEVTTLYLSNPKLASVVIDKLNIANHRP